MAKGWIHTEYRAGRWINSVEGGPILGAYGSQAEAKAAGEAEALGRWTTHVVHRIDGSIVRSDDARGAASPGSGAEQADPGDDEGPPGLSFRSGGWGGR